MELLVLGSSSHGNGYILQNDTEALVIEAGVPFKDIKKGLGWDLGKVRGCLISHRHNDHAGHAAELDKAGIAILAPSDVVEAKKLTRHAHAVQPGRGYKLGGFKVLPFSLMHDTPCYGYLIEHPECGRVLFATDTYTIGTNATADGSWLLHTFRGVNHWLIEANYTTWIVDRNMKSGHLTEAMKKRLMLSHLSLGNCIKALQRQDLSQTERIVLIHLSDGNSDERMFVKKVRDATGKRVVAAKSGLSIDITKISKISNN